MQPKMHLVSILYNGNIYTAFVKFADGKPVLTTNSFQKLTSGLVRSGETFSVG